MKFISAKLIPIAGVVVIAASAILLQPAGKAASRDYGTIECGFCTPYEKLVRVQHPSGTWVTSWTTCYRPVGGSGVCPPCDDPLQTGNFIIEVE